jgi:hypothetical protein
MAETKETFKVKDFTDTVKGITGMVKENYLNGVDLYFSLWTENLKVLDSQLEQWFGIQQEYIKAGKEVYEKLPKEFGVFTNSDTADRFLAIQKDYVATVKKVSDKFAKDTLNIAHKNAEKAFSLVDDYLKLFRA